MDRTQQGPVGLKRPERRWRSLRGQSRDRSSMLATGTLPLWPSTPATPPPQSAADSLRASV